MDRRFITHKIKKLKEERLNQLNKTLLKQIKTAKDKGKLQQRIEGRMKETRFFAKFLNKYFNETQDFKLERERRQPIIPISRRQSLN